MIRIHALQTEAMTTLFNETNNVIWKDRVILSEDQEDELLDKTSPIYHRLLAQILEIKIAEEQTQTIIQAKG
jgi:hypothetical protein